MRRVTMPLIKRFAKDWLDCTRLIGSPIYAYRYLRARHTPEIGSFHFYNLNFFARKQDWPAIREVILDDEYLCIEWLFSTGAKLKVLDLGANIGCFAMRTFLRYPDAQVISVEAAADTFSILSTNQQANPLLNWKVFNFGIWGSDGPLTLERRGISLGHRVVEGEGEECIQGVSLKSLLTRLSWERVDLMKIDIEGGEESVIPSSMDILVNTRALIIEVHSDRIDAKLVMDKLNSLFEFRWQLNPPGGGKQVYLMTHEPIPAADVFFSR